MFNPPDLSHEPESVLFADSVNMQALIAVARTVCDAAEKNAGRAITRHAENNLEDFHNGLMDLISDLEGAHERIEEELERRESAREREHERIESQKITLGVASPLPPICVK